jgi:hypothetical protein
VNPEPLESGARVRNGGDPLAGVDAGFPEGAVGSYYVGLLRSAAEAAALREAVDPPDAAREFLGGSDLGSQAAVFRDGRSASAPDLSVDGIRRTTAASNSGRPTRVRGATSDVAADNLLVRFPRADRPTLRYATVTHVGRGASAGSTFSTDGKFGLSRRRDPVDLSARTRHCSDRQVDLSATVRGELQFDRTSSA